MTDLRRQIAITRIPYMDIDCQHLPTDLYEDFVCFPREMIPLLDMAITAIYTREQTTPLDGPIMVGIGVAFL